MNETIRYVHANVSLPKILRQKNFMRNGRAALKKWTDLQSMNLRLSPWERNFLFLFFALFCLLPNDWIFVCFLFAESFDSEGHYTAWIKHKARRFIVKIYIHTNTQYTYIYKTRIEMMNLANFCIRFVLLRMGFEWVWACVCEFVSLCIKNGLQCQWYEKSCPFGDYIILV